MVETGQAAQGVTLLEKAVRLAPNSTTLRFHYALGLIANGQVAQGQRELETLLARKDDFAERARAQMTLQQLQ
jgi:predicted Zn-dependent protease